MSQPKINIPQLGLFLGFVAGTAAALLAVVDSATQTPRDARQADKTRSALQQVLPPFDYIDDHPVVLTNAAGWVITYHIARRDGSVAGFAGSVTTPEGFSGDIDVMVGLEPDGAVRKVMVLQHTETPGLGTAITDRKIEKTLAGLFGKKGETTSLPPNPYLDQYEGRRGGGTPWRVRNDGGEIDAKTGATITSRAVCGAVHAIAATGHENLEALFNGANP